VAALCLAAVSQLGFELATSMTAFGRLHSVTSVSFSEAKSPSLDNCLLIIQKVRVGVPSDTQNTSSQTQSTLKKKRFRYNMVQKAYQIRVVNRF